MHNDSVSIPHDLAHKCRHILVLKPRAVKKKKRKMINVLDLYIGI